MATILTDGFDLYGTAAGTNLATKWTTTIGTPSSAVTPYGAGQSMSIATGVTPGIATSFTAVSSFTVGLAFRTTAVGGLGTPGTAGSQCLLGMLSGSTYMIGLQLNTDGSLQVNRQTAFNSGTSLGFTAPNIIKANAWYYIELAVSISDTVGTVRIDVDGSTVLNLSSQDTRNGTPTTINTIYLNSFNNAAFTTYFDDLYITDTTTPLGPRRIYTLLPNADTAQKQWTALTGVDNFAMVDDPIIDGDTTYVQASTVGNFDLYDVANLTPASATISSVNHTVWARKTDVTARTLNLTTKSSSTTTDSTAVALATTYTGFNRIYDTDPATGSAWTVSGVNALQIGQKVAS